MPYYGTPDTGTETSDGQCPCARGIWCAARTVTVEDGQRVTKAATSPRPFCDRDATTIANCIGDLPGIYLRLSGELHHPVQAETQVHAPFGPSIPVRLDADEAMRLIAVTLALWESRVRAQAPAQLLPRDPGKPVHAAKSVKEAAGTLASHMAALFALQPAYATTSHPVPPGRARRANRGVEAVCARCGRLISRTPVGGRWYSTDPGPALISCIHVPDETAIVRGPSSPLPAELAEELADEEIIYVGADFIAVTGELGARDAGLDLLHLHYWGRAVLRETPARPEELIGVECRSCSLMALRRAEPPWYPGDPEFYSECLNCGDLSSEDDYRVWVGQLHAYHAAREAARPTLAQSPCLPAGVAGAGGRA